MSQPNTPDDRLPENTLTGAETPEQPLALPPADPEGVPQIPTVQTPTLQTVGEGVSQDPASRPQTTQTQTTTFSTPGVTGLGVIELREEVVEVRRERAQAGQISFRREVRTRTETVTTELRQEVLVIETKPGGPTVLLDGEELPAGETREVVVYDEQTVVSKAPFVVEEVHVGRRTVTTQQQQALDLQYEVLVVDEQPALGEQLQRQQTTEQTVIRGDAARPDDTSR